MIRCRQRYAGLAVMLATGLVTGFAVQAQSGPAYPNKPVRLVVPFAPGGGTDIIARLVAQKLGDALGQSFVADNRGGAGGTVGTAIAVKSAPDGYTLLLVSLSVAVNESLYRKLPYSAAKELAPISLVATQPNILVVHPAVAAKSTAELVALAKAKPGQIAYASGGAGGSSHLSTELFRVMAGIDIVHVAYKGTGPALTELVAGQTQMTISPIAQAIGMVQAGRLRALAVTGEKRVPQLPQVPTIAESGVPGYEFTTWYGMFAPAGTPRPVLATLNRELKRVAEAADVRERYAAAGLDALHTSEQDFARYFHAEIAKWAKVVKGAGIQTN